MSKLTHLDADGRASMVDVSAKAETHRRAAARGRVYMAQATLALIAEGGMKKGDVFSVARLAGIMAAKKTADLIPLCHPLPLQNIQVNLECNPGDSCVEIFA
ncbi:MAG: cyclic pyranopterin monophosphate synthase MoaC, partial [Alphaproteobacteria bacterium]|nr:cyclic pyranopterin monophosphate synthase MoaC [Alphaproteobacteria bacterium]